MKVLVIPDPDEWVQKPRIPHVVSVADFKLEEFSKNALDMNGKDMREWLILHGARLVDGAPLSEIDYVVCSW